MEASGDKNSAHSHGRETATRKKYTIAHPNADVEISPAHRHAGLVGNPGNRVRLGQSPHLARTRNCDKPQTHGSSNGIPNRAALGAKPQNTKLSTKRAIFRNTRSVPSQTRASYELACSACKASLATAVGTDGPYLFF